MKLKFIFLFFFFLSTPFLFSSPEPDLYALRVPKLTHDFGQVMRGEKLSYVFEMYNEGSEVITVTDIHASCGCTTTTKAPFDIFPGESRAIEITVDTKGRTGRMKQEVSVLTSDPRRKDLKFYLLGHIRTGARLDNSVVQFDHSKHGKKKKIKINLLENTDRPINVKEITSSVSFLEFKTHKRNQKKKSTPIEVILPKKSPIGPFRGWVYVVTDEELDPTYWIRVFGEVID